MPRIFISYRRDDTKATAGRLYDRLEPVFGAENIFMDVDDIPPGVDFRAYLQTAITEADVVLIIIGTKWASILKDRRKDTNDFVRIELESALEQRKITIPVLVDGAQMPPAGVLSKRIASVFSYLNAASLGDGAVFRRDVDRLIAKLQNLESLQLPPELPSINQTKKWDIPVPVWQLGLASVLLITLAILVGVYVLPQFLPTNVTPTGEVAAAISNTPTEPLAPTSTVLTSSLTPTFEPTSTVRHKRA